MSFNKWRFRGAALTPAILSEYPSGDLDELLNECIGAALFGRCFTHVVTATATNAPPRLVGLAIAHTTIVDGMGECLRLDAFQLRNHDEMRLYQQFEASYFLLGSLLGHVSRMKAFHAMLAMTSDEFLESSLRLTGFQPPQSVPGEWVRSLA